MTTSEAGKRFLKNNEGFRDKAYQCSANKWTIGYGTTIMTFDDGKSLGVTPEIQITQEMADQFFNNDLKKFEGYVNTLVRVPLTQTQFDALVSFIYNIGVNGFKKSILLQKLNKSDYAGATKGFDGWHIPKDIIPRRNKEKNLFATGDYTYKIHTASIDKLKGLKK